MLPEVNNSLSSSIRVNNNPLSSETFSTDSVPTDLCMSSAERIIQVTAQLPHATTYVATSESPMPHFPHGPLTLEAPPPSRSTAHARADSDEILDIARGNDLILERKWDELFEVGERLEKRNNTLESYAYKALACFGRQDIWNGENNFKKFTESKADPQMQCAERLVVDFLRLTNCMLALRCAQKLTLVHLPTESRLRVLKSYGSLLLNSYFQKKTPPFKLKREDNGDLDLLFSNPDKSSLKKAKDIFTKASALAPDDDYLIVSLNLIQILLGEKDSFDILKKNAIKTEQILKKRVPYTISFLICLGDVFEAFFLKPQEARKYCMNLFPDWKKHSINLSHVKFMKMRRNIETINALTNSIPVTSLVLIDKTYLQYNCLEEILNLKAIALSVIDPSHSVKDLWKPILEDVEKLIRDTSKERNETFYHLYRATLNYSLGDYEKAYEQGLQLYQYDPLNPFSILNLSRTGIRVRKDGVFLSDIIQKYFSSDRSRNPDFTDVNIKLVKIWIAVLASLKQDKLLEDFSTHIRPKLHLVCKNNEETRVLLRDFADLVLLYHPDLLKDFLELCLEIVPEDQGLLFRLGEVHYDGMRWEALVKCLQKIPVPLKDQNIKNTAKFFVGYAYGTLLSGKTVTEVFEAYKYLPAASYMIHLPKAVDNEEQLKVFEDILGTILSDTVECTQEMTDENKKELFSQIFISALFSLQLLPKSLAPRKNFIEEIVLILKKSGFLAWLEAHDIYKPELLQKAKSIMLPKDYKMLLEKLGVMEPDGKEGKSKVVSEKSEEKNVTDFVAEQEIEVESQSGSTKPIEANLQELRKEQEEEKRIEEAREKARLLDLRKEAKLKQKLEKKVKKVDVSTKPFPLSRPPIAGAEDPEWPPNFRFSPKYTESNVLELTKKMLRGIPNIEFEEKKKKASEPFIPQPYQPRPIELAKLEDLKPYRKKNEDAASYKGKEKVQQKMEAEAPAPVNDPNVNRVEAARRSILEFENLVKTFERDFPQSVEKNVFIVNRALMYYLLRFGESLYSTSEKSRLSDQVTAEINQHVFSIELAHLLRDEVRNWFPCMHPGRLMRTAKELGEYKIHDALKAWVANKDSEAAGLKADSKGVRSSQKSSVLFLSPLVAKEEKDKWKALDPAEKKARYLKILLRELDCLSQIPDPFKMDRSTFCQLSKTHQSAIKMSISIIAKCFTGLSLDCKAFAELKYLSSLIGHEIGEMDQIRYYDYEEIKDVEILYDLALSAKDLKKQILAIR